MSHDNDQVTTLTYAASSPSRRTSGSHLLLLLPGLSQVSRHYALLLRHLSLAIRRAHPMINSAPWVQPAATSVSAARWLCSYLICNVVSQQTIDRLYARPTSAMTNKFTRIKCSNWRALGRAHTSATPYAAYDTIRYDILTCAQKLTKWPA